MKQLCALASPPCAPARAEALVEKKSQIFPEEPGWPCACLTIVTSLRITSHDITLTPCQSFQLLSWRVQPYFHEHLNIDCSPPGRVQVSLPATGALLIHRILNTTQLPPTLNTGESYYFLRPSATKEHHPSTRAYSLSAPLQNAQLAVV